MLHEIIIHQNTICSLLVPYHDVANTPIFGLLHGTVLCYFVLVVTLLASRMWVGLRLAHSPRHGVPALRPSPFPFTHYRHRLEHLVHDSVRLQISLEELLAQQARAVRPFLWVLLQAEPHYLLRCCAYTRDRKKKNTTPYMCNHKWQWHIEKPSRKYSKVNERTERGIAVQYCISEITTNMSSGIGSPRLFCAFWQSRTAPPDVYNYQHKLWSIWAGYGMNAENTTWMKTVSVFTKPETHKKRHWICLPFPLDYFASRTAPTINYLSRKKWNSKTRHKVCYETSQTNKMLTGGGTFYKHVLLYIQIKNTCRIL